MNLEISAQYDWIKAIHVACVVIWVGSQIVMGLLILALQQQNALKVTDSELSVRVSWLINGVINLAMFGAFLFGGLLVSLYWSADAPIPTWLWFKAAFVLVLASIHGLLYRQYKRVKRQLELLPVVVLDGSLLASILVAVAIVILAMMKPFN